MGGVLGAASITQIPGLDGAYLQVPGSGIADILYHRSCGRCSPASCRGEPARVTPLRCEGLATLLLDPAENSYLVDRLRDGRLRCSCSTASATAWSPTSAPSGSPCSWTCRWSGPRSHR